MVKEIERDMNWDLECEVQNVISGCKECGRLVERMKKARMQHYHSRGGVNMTGIVQFWWTKHHRVSH